MKSIVKRDFFLKRQYVMKTEIFLKILQTNNCYLLFCSFFRHRRIGEIYIYKTNEDHSWSGLLGRRQAWFHQVGLSKHLHGHAEHDPSDGSPEASVRGPHIRGKITNSDEWKSILPNKKEQFMIIRIMTK